MNEAGVQNGLMGSLEHVIWLGEVLPQRHSQLARPFCTCRLYAVQAAAPRGNPALLGAIFCRATEFSDTCDRILGSRVMSDKLASADNSMSGNATDVEQKCLTDYRGPDECLTKQQVRNSVYEGD